MSNDNIHNPDNTDAAHDAGDWLLRRQVAELAGLNIDTVRRWQRNSGLTVRLHPTTGEVMFSAAELCAHGLIDPAQATLPEQSVPRSRAERVADARRQVATTRSAQRTAHTMKPTSKTSDGYRLIAIPAALVELLLQVVPAFDTHDSGLLPFHVKNDTAGRRDVTQTSVKAELARRHRPVQDQVPVVEFMQVTGLGRHGINALVKHGKLVRAGRDGLTVDSVAAWAYGFRPDLLDSKLLTPRMSA